LLFHRSKGLGLKRPSPLWMSYGVAVGAGLAFFFIA